MINKNDHDKITDSTKDAKCEYNRIIDKNVNLNVQIWEYRFVFLIFVFG